MLLFLHLRKLEIHLRMMGNVFFALDTKHIIEEVSAISVQNTLAKGEQQFNDFTRDRLVQRTKPITDPVHRNRNHLFSRLKKAQRAESVLKSDCSLFSRLSIACQTRQGDMKEFFSHENRAFPPSLSNLGEMRAGKKSDLLTCLDQKLCYTELVCPLEQACSTFSTPDTIPDDNVSTEDLVVFENMLQVDLVQVSSEMVLDDTNFPNQGTTDQTAKILDGAFIVQMLSLKSPKTFQDYTDGVFMPYIVQQLNSVHRLDVVRDVYIAENLKTSTRQKRGHGQQRKASPSALERIPFRLERIPTK